MMLLLILIMMLKFCVKESSNLIGLKNFGAAGFFIAAGLGFSAPPFSLKVTKSLPIPPFPPPNFYIIIT